MAGRTNLTEAERDALRAKLVARIPSWYRPWVHVAFPSFVGLGLATAACLLLRDVHAWQLLMVPLAFVLINAGEWRIHRDVLHKRTPPLQLLYERHTPEHHMVFLTDDMAMRSTREFRLVLIPAYGIFAALIGALPVPIVLALCGQWNLAMLFLATAMVYVVSYEQLHLAYHLPPTSFIGRLRLIAFLRRHHAIHHSPERMQKWNFNVTIPLWDFVRGTIYRDDRIAKTVTRANAS